MSRPGRAFYLLMALAAAAGGTLALGLAGGLRALSGGVATKWVSACAGWVTSASLAAPPLAATVAAAAILLFWRGAAVLATDVRRTRRTLHLLRSHLAPRSPTLDEAARRVGVAGAVELLRSDAPLCFCYGYWRPRICVSDALATGVHEHELEALLLHEDYHRRLRDPLKSLLADTVARTFFFLPLLSVLRRRYLWARELAADRYAVRRQGGPAGLAGALLKVAAGPAMPALVPAASGEALMLIDARIDQLTGRQAGTGPDRIWRPALATAIWLVAAGLAVRWLWASAVTATPAVSDPMAAMMRGGMPASMMGGAGSPAWLPVVGAAAAVGVAWIASMALSPQRR